MSTVRISDEEKFRLVGDAAPELEDIENMENESSEEIMEAMEDEGKNSKTKRIQKVHIQRYKGLGEMNADELWETTMDPNTRLLKQVSIHDAVDADKVFDMLMGTDVAPRKSFIQSHAKQANLDF